MGDVQNEPVPSLLKALAISWEISGCCQESTNAQNFCLARNVNVLLAKPLNSECSTGGHAVWSFVVHAHKQHIHTSRFLCHHVLPVTLIKPTTRKVLPQVHPPDPFVQSVSKGNPGCLLYKQMVGYLKNPASQRDVPGPLSEDEAASSSLSQPTDFRFEQCQPVFGEAFICLCFPAQSSQGKSCRNTAVLVQLCTVPSEALCHWGIVLSARLQLSQ